MLDRLPNELLVRIFERSTIQLTQECRLLSTRFNNLIERYELHKCNINILRLSPTTWGRGKIISTTCDLYLEMNTKSKKSYTKTFDNCGELLTAMAGDLHKIRKLTTLNLVSIQITKKMTEAFLDKKCLSNLKRIHVTCCNMDEDAVEKWFQFLGQQKLDELRVQFSFQNKEAKVPVPAMILKKVDNYYEYNTFPSYPGNGYRVFDISWLDDDHIEQWYSPGKMLIIPTCIVSITIRGVLNCLEKLAKVNKPDGILEFGILKHETAGSVEEVMLDCGVTYSVFSDENELYFEYQINYIREERVVAHFAVPIQKEADAN